ncbi:venom carboxylesterase-6-like [Schistocerca nitens]|uniref:venom carboxylesterase-6-like n=1 Tax=Schistocerca nitens TaxID=7011 RepID=UPI0021186F6A|nr:venom carboxylesterase-6-like [Schistocerca nitens]
MRSAVLLLVGALCVGLSDSAPRPQLQQGDDVFVTVETGGLRGVVSTSLNGTLYNKFVGIPFATPPLGNLASGRVISHYEVYTFLVREVSFSQIPVTLIALFRLSTCIKQCATLGSVLSSSLEHTGVQLGGTDAPKGRGSEDCLYVNVYVPLVNDSSPLAVMVNIHGGGNTTGFSRFRRPDFFMDKGVLVVTFNYRLGSIGFLSLQNDDIPGNAGLKDQVFALQWVQCNIAAFGGDPDKVTIFGESAGGSSTSHLFLSLATKGLFRGAIMESGVANGNWSVEPSPREKAGGGARLPDAGRQRFRRSCLLEDRQPHRPHQGQQPGPLRLPTVVTSPREKRIHRGIAFSPVIEPQSDTAVVTESPGDILRVGRYNQVPVMAGVTSADGGVIVEWMRHFTGNAYVVVASGILTDEAYAADMRENFTLLVGSQLPVPTVEEQIEAAVKVENFYFEEKGFSVDNTQAVYDMFSDMNFIQPTEEFAGTVANTSGLPVYLYYFDYDAYGANEYDASSQQSHKFVNEGITLCHPGGG